MYGASYKNISSTIDPSNYTSPSNNGFLSEYFYAGMLEIIIAHYILATDVFIFSIKPTWLIQSKSNTRAKYLSNDPKEDNRLFV